MQLIGFLPENIGSGSKFNFAPGLGRIEAATAAVETLGSMTAAGIRFTIQRLNQDMKPTGDEPVVEFVTANSVLNYDGDPAFSVGKMSSPTDDNPDDLGADDDTEGNCLLSAPGAKYSIKFGLAHFIQSLEKQGFKHSFLTGYTPHFVGMVAEFGREMLKESTDPKKQSITALVAKKILEFPYEKKGGAAAGKASAAGSASSKKESAASAASAAPASSGDGDEETESKAVECLIYLGEKLAGEEVTRKKVQTQLMLAFNKLKIAPKMHKAIQELVKTESWFDEKADGLGWAVNGQSVAIPAAE